MYVCMNSFSVRKTDLKINISNHKKKKIISSMVSQNKAVMEQNKVINVYLPKIVGSCNKKRIYLIKDYMFKFCC